MTAQDPIAERARPQLTAAQRSQLCLLAGRLSGMAIALKNGWADPQRAGDECERAYHELIQFVQQPDQPDDEDFHGRSFAKALREASA